MKPNTLIISLIACVATALISGSLLSGAHAGGGGDDIVIFRSTQSERITRYFQTSVSTPDAKVREGNRATSYVILNLATGGFRELQYWTETQVDLDGKRSRVKLFRAQRFDGTAEAIFQTGPTDRRNYLILSLYGTGMGNNVSFAQNGNAVTATVTSETLEGVMRV
jgi:hypothetical protein